MQPSCWSTTPFLHPCNDTIPTPPQKSRFPFGGSRWHQELEPWSILCVRSGHDFNSHPEGSFGHKNVFDSKIIMSITQKSLVQHSKQGNKAWYAYCNRSEIRFHAPEDSSKQSCNFGSSLYEAFGFSGISGSRLRFRIRIRVCATCVTIRIWVWRALRN